MPQIKSENAKELQELKDRAVQCFKEIRGISNHTSK